MAFRSPEEAPGAWILASRDEKLGRKFVDCGHGASGDDAILAGNVIMMPIRGAVDPYPSTRTVTALIAHRSAQLGGSDVGGVNRVDPCGAVPLKRMQEIVLISDNVGFVVACGGGGKRGGDGSEQHPVGSMLACGLLLLRGHYL